MDFELHSLKLLSYVDSEFFAAQGIQLFINIVGIRVELKIDIKSIKLLVLDFR